MVFISILGIASEISIFKQSLCYKWHSICVELGLGWELLFWGELMGVCFGSWEGKVQSLVGAIVKGGWELIGQET